MAIPAARAKALDQRLVVRGELGPADLVGEVEVAVDLVAHLDGYTQKRGHRWMAGGESIALGMGAQLGRSGADGGH